MTLNELIKQERESKQRREFIKRGLHPDEDPVWATSGKMLNAETYSRIKNRKLRQLMERIDREKYIDAIENSVLRGVSEGMGRYA